MSRVGAYNIYFYKEGMTMEYLYERVAYLRGLARDLDFRGTKEGRVLEEIVEILGEFADAISLNYLISRKNWKSIPS